MGDFFPAVKALQAVLRQTPNVTAVDEPGFASTFVDPTLATALYKYSPVIPLGSAAAGLWYLNRQRKKRKAPAQNVEKQAVDWAQVLDNVRHHLPKLRLPDTAAGMLLGGGVGGFYDLVRGRDKETGKRKTLQRVLAGALTGAGVSNLAGDRLRRYLSNTKIPVGNAGNALEEIKPTWNRIWNAAILDKPDYVKDPQYEHIGHLMPARRELVRRQFGLPVDDPKNPWWQKNKGGYYSLNEASPDYSARLRLLFGHSPQIKKDRDVHLLELLKDPAKKLTQLNTTAETPTSKDTPLLKTDLFGFDQLLGGMQVPFEKRPDGVYGMVLDRWDQTPNAKERAFIRNNLWRALTDKKWRDQPMTKNLSWYVQPGRQDNNAQTMQILLGRWAWDNVLSDELPWVGQKFRVYPHGVPKPWGASDGYTPNMFAYLRENNTPAMVPRTYYEMPKWNQKNPLRDTLIASWREQMKAPTAETPSIK